jgi:hypothetical protein
MNKKIRSRLYPVVPVFMFLVWVLLTQPGCKNYNSVDLYPPCDTTNVTYSHDIYPIVEANCLPCHTTANNLGGIILDNVDSARIPAQNGLLLKAVTWDPSVVPMPKGGAQLSECDIDKFTRWVNLGEPAK